MGFTVLDDQKKKYDVKINIGNTGAYLMISYLSADEDHEINAATTNKRKNMLTGAAYDLKERQRLTFHKCVGGWGGFNNGTKEIKFSPENLDKFLKSRELSSTLKTELIEMMTNHIQSGVQKESDPQP